ARSIATCSRSLPRAASASARVSPSGWRLEWTNPSPRWTWRPPSRHFAIHVSPFGPARRISVPLPYRAPRCVRSTAALFVSDPVTTAPILPPPLYHFGRKSRQLRATHVNSEIMILQRKCGQIDHSRQTLGAYLWSRRSGVRVPSLTLSEKPQISGAFLLGEGRDSCLGRRPCTTSLYRSDPAWLGWRLAEGAGDRLRGPRNRRPRGARTRPTQPCSAR